MNPFCEILEQTQWIHQWLYGVGVGDIASKVLWEMFWGDGNDIYLDYEGSYMDVYVFQDSSNCTLKVDALAEKGEHV